MTVFKKFQEWHDAFLAGKTYPGFTDMTLATATKDGKPSARIVLLKSYDKRGFVFYTNLESRKSIELKENPHAALCFYWGEQRRQVRIEGKVEHTSDEEADAYYASRPLISRLGALASAQSRPLASREILMQKVDELKAIYSETNPPPRPAYWSGWRLIPERVEFWQEGEFRLHDREVYTRASSGWDVMRLYP